MPAMHGGRASAPMGSMARGVPAVWGIKLPADIRSVLPTNFSSPNERETERDSHRDAGGHIHNRGMAD